MIVIWLTHEEYTYVINYGVGVQKLEIITNNQKLLYLIIPDKWNISADRYDKYAITKTKIGSMILTWWVKRDTNAAKNPQIIPITVPPIAITKNDAKPAK